MAAEVSSNLVQCLNNGYEEDKSTLITQDLLGTGIGSNIASNQELDLDLQVPKGWEKRLDLKSGKVYLQRCSSPKPTSSILSSSDRSNNQAASPSPTPQDLNFPPSLSKSNALNLNLFFDDDAPFLDLKLRSSTSPSISGNNNYYYQSVCTLEKVKSALERAEREPIVAKKPSRVRKSSSSPSSSSSSTSLSLREEDATDDKMSRWQSQSQVAAGCPSCLLYVLISRTDPKCPRCNALVPFSAAKKPRIDLNISI